MKWLIIGVILVISVFFIPFWIFPLCLNCCASYDLYFNQRIIVILMLLSCSITAFYIDACEVE